MEKHTEESESLVHESNIVELSRAEHEKFCLKKGRPFSKAKYS